MKITSIKKRHDGKSLVRLLWSNGVTLSKVMTAERLATTQKQIHEQQKQEEEYRLKKGTP